ncbi:hypothetical protein QYS36_19270 [Pseudomonas sp. G34]|uniref:hypothetical protein n=1 Tax=Pseudomonas sp. G34 TaxID=3059083 RepID=UPI0028089DFC|nr:hypothetical protein [Pseudomonas sp. G34]MDQ7987086.1 hypothetical protein [Pseudomonas sp. G34]
MARIVSGKTGADTMSRWKKTGKASALGGATGAAACGSVGLLFGRAAVFGGVLGGIGAPAFVALAVVGAVAGTIAGGVNSLIEEK